MHTLLAAAKHQQRARSASTDTRHTRARPNFTMQTDADSAQMDQLQLCGERKEGRRKLGAQETRKSSRSCTSTFRLYRPRQHTHFLASLTLCSDPETQEDHTTVGGDTITDIEPDDGGDGGGFVLLCTQELFFPLPSISRACLT